MTIKPVVMHTIERTDAEGRTRDVTQVLDVDPNMTIQELAEKVLAHAVYERPAPDPFGPDADNPDRGERTLLPKNGHLTIKVAHPLSSFKSL